MISREDFVFTIGFDGAMAVVDGRAKRQYGRLSTMQLAETGLYRAAFSSALYSKDEAEMRAFLDYFNAKAGTAYTEAEQLKRLFGVNEEGISRVLVL
ncbi:MAG TPA: hypothetical protein VMV90_00210 [Rectinemataceae bacterium]|nr:hypothetical protein [Rectinemataceae bacterium]